MGFYYTSSDTNSHFTTVRLELHPLRLYGQTLITEFVPHGPTLACVFYVIL